MKSKGLLSILTFSEKRKDILFLLEEKSCTLSDIKDYFNVSSPEISPRIKEMLENNLIEKTDKNYQITPVGRAIIHHFRPFLDIIETIENNETFWKEHYLCDIPQDLLNDLISLKECNVVSDSIENIYESHKVFVENILKSSVIKGVSSIFIPTYPDFVVNLAKREVPTSLILTEKVFEKVRDEHHEKLEIYLNAPHTELYVIDDVKLAFVVTDIFFSMSLFFNPDTYDPRDDLVGYDEAALKWGSDLFDHYVQKSRKVTSI
ncbi:helix-turn-helix transcriptional regulator [Methanolobus bombayensis]|uniref:helix-turn-helix transcriptional regulator n=1 Tax=Methanolobus bombayensis TaxID=38023 RepID=UPI001AE8A6B2|nr:winged helix-turn-helix domain-containing protein [Methanolobus bombayensis]MBP1909643.1 putative transcriptional regulator [Methanolobus bombayensis]